MSVRPVLYLVPDVDDVVEFDDVGMVEQFHRFQFARQKFLLKVDRCASFVNDLESHSPAEILRKRPLYLHVTQRHLSAIFFRSVTHSFIEHSLIICSHTELRSVKSDRKARRPKLRLWRGTDNN